MEKLIITAAICGAEVTKKHNPAVPYTVEELVRDYITEENGDPETFGNARGVRNIFEHILVAQNNRLAAMETVTKEDLMTLTQDDVLHARGKLD